MENTALARHVAETGIPLFSSDGSGPKWIAADVPHSASIPKDTIRQAASFVAKKMDKIPKDRMIDQESMSVDHDDGCVRYKLEKLDDQDKDDERWDEDYQPLTTAKVTAHCAWVLLRRWQTSMLLIYRKDTKIEVFSQEELDSLGETVKTGNKANVLKAISTISSVAIEELDHKFRY